MAEQGGAEAGGFERPAELQDKSEDVKLHGPGRGSAADECLGAEGSEADEACRLGRGDGGDEGAVPLELEEIPSADGDAPPPTADQLAAEAEAARDLALATLVDLDRDHGVEDQLDRMNFPRDGVAGKNPLPAAATRATGQRHRERLVAAIAADEASLHRGPRQPNVGPAAACAVAATKQILRAGGDGDREVATLDVRYVNHVLLDDPAAARQKQTRGRLSMYAERPPTAPQGLLAARERYEWDAILTERGSRHGDRPPVVVAKPPAVLRSSRPPACAEAQA